MPKHTESKRSKDAEQYNSSSVSAVWIVLITSVALAGIVVIGTIV